MFFGEIKTTDIANGPGVRVSLFVSGCTHHCPGCFNEDTWSFSYGKRFTEDTKREILAALSPNHIAGLTVLGGEPMEPEHQRELLPLFSQVKKEFPDKSIWVYSGYLYDREILSELPAGTALPAEKNVETLSAGEGTNAVIADGGIRFLYRNTKGDLVQLPSALRSAHCEVTRQMLSMVNVMVDGKFIASEKDLMLRFRGSRNQRLVDVQKSLAQEKVVLWDV